MKRILSFLVLFLCLSGGAFAEETILDFRNEAAIKAMGLIAPETGTVNISEFTYQNITLTPYKGTENVRINKEGSPKDDVYYTLRYYKSGGGIELSVPAGSNITAIAIKGNTALKDTECDKGSITMSSDNKTLTWTPSETTETSVKFTNNVGNPTNVETITVTYETGSVTPPAVATPTITGETPFFGTSTITLDCETDGASIYYTTDGVTEPTAESTLYSAPFGIHATTTIKAIAIKDEDKSTVVTKEFVANPVVSTVAELNALANNSTFRFDGEALVVAKQTKGTNNYVFIKDATGASLVFDAGATKTADLTVGKTISSGWTGKVSIYNNLFEVIPDAALAVTDGEPVEVTYEEATPADITADNVNKVVTLKGVTYTEPANNNFQIKKGEETVAGYNQFGIDIAAPDEGKLYDIVGVIGIFKENLQFQPITITRVAETVDAVVNAAEGDIATAVATKKKEIEDAGDKVGNITINLAKDATYTLGATIETTGSLVINGNGATVDASANTATLISLTDGYVVEGNEYKRIDNVKIENVTLKGVKGSLIYDNNNKLCLVDLTVNNAVIEFVTEAANYETLIAFQGGGIKDVNITNSTFYGNNAVAKYFIRYHNNARLDRYGFDKDTEFQTMNYQNNTFHGLLKSDGQWGNYSGIAGQKYSKFDVKNNIWYNCGKDIIRRMAGGRFADNVPQDFANNTYFNEGKDNSTSEASYDKSGSILVTDPSFKDAANADFTLGESTQQAKFQTGDPRWMTAYVAATLDKTALETEIATATTLLGDAETAEGTPGAALKAAIDAAQTVLAEAEFQMEIDEALAALIAAEEAYNVATGISEITTEADANAPVYNLSGQRVTNSTKGIVIKNGKKYLSK